MRTITVTTHRAKNYGAVLQAYALHKTLLKLGFQNELLDTPNEDNSVFEKVSFSSFRSFLITNYMNFLRLFRYKKMKKQLYGFKQFVDDNIKCTRKYYSLEEVNLDMSDIDCLITGSDQVFAVDCKINQFLFDLRFLNFGDSCSKRVSYAASAGNLNLNETEKNLLLTNLKKFDFISLREPSLKSYYEGFLDYDFRVDLDPTLLLKNDEWEQLKLERKIPEDYIFCYSLLGNENLEKVIHYLREKLHLKVVCLQADPHKRIKADKYIFDASPIDFLSYIKYSSFVVTTSFHGTAFSVIFEKEFLTLVKNYKSERMSDLLSTLGLERCIVKESELNLIVPNIDYSLVNEKLDILRENSLDYLRRLDDGN